jgi:hypothetical protein
MSYGLRHYRDVPSAYPSDAYFCDCCSNLRYTDGGGYYCALNDSKIVGYYCPECANYYDSNNGCGYCCELNVAYQQQLKKKKNNRPSQRRRKAIQQRSNGLLK